MKKIAAFGLLAGVVAAPTSATSYGVELRGFVPVSCHITGHSAIVDVTNATADLGNVREFCNNAAGYELYLDYAPHMAGAVVLIDGESVALDSDGTASLAAEAGPAFRSRSVQIDLTGVEDASDLAISFRIVPR
jgi:hypothetical protein